VVRSLECINALPSFSKKKVKGVGKGQKPPGGRSKKEGKSKSKGAPFVCLHYLYSINLRSESDMINAVQAAASHATHMCTRKNKLNDSKNKDESSLAKMAQ
jgi:hypothetical protein